MDDLDRLHQHLVAALRDGFPHLLGRRFRLRDIPEHFVEYRKRRSELGFQSASQYEVALMRLAAGERGYLQGDAAAQDAFRRALAGPEPDVTLLRQHGDAQVWLPDSAHAVAGITGAVDASAREPIASDAPIAPPPAEAPGTPPSMPPPPPAAPVRRRDTAPQEPATGPRAGGGACHYCGHALPEGRPVTYCPNCGQNVTVRHCPACSTELEVGWHFCITCGRAMDETGLGAPAP